MDHGIAEANHDCTFGELTNLSDRLFGAHVARGPDIDRVEIGLEAPSGRRTSRIP